MAMNDSGKRGKTGDSGYCSELLSVVSGVVNRKGGAREEEKQSA